MAKLRTEKWGGIWSVTVYDIRIIKMFWEAPDGHQVKAVPRFDSNICSTPPIMWNMPGLDPDTSYVVTEVPLGLRRPPMAPLRLSGRQLVAHGLQLPVVAPESGVLLHLDATV
jgi:hypothetical protein